MSENSTPTPTPSKIDLRYLRLETPSKAREIASKVSYILGRSPTYQDKWISNRGKTYKFTLIDNREAKLEEVRAYLDTLSLPKGTVRVYLRREEESTLTRDGLTVRKLLPGGSTLIYSGINLAIDFTKFEGYVK